MRCPRRSVRTLAPKARSTGMAAIIGELPHSFQHFHIYSITLTSAMRIDRQNSLLKLTPFARSLTVSIIVNTETPPHLESPREGGLTPVQIEGVEHVLT